MPQGQQRDLRLVLPEITWDKIVPPYPNYPYFQGASAHPFRPHARDFDIVNAWWLIEAATLSYSPEEFVRERFRDAGLTEVAFFDGPGTQVFAASNDEFLILVFRGTETRPRPGHSSFCNILADLMADADFLLEESGYGGKVHRGFRAALDEVWERQGLVDYLKSKNKGTRTFWFTGHSLGAALATLAAQRYVNLHALYTFGSPRVGDQAFRQALPVRTYRFVNRNDAVTHVPPGGAYHHVGELKYLDSQGQLRPNSHLWEPVLDALEDEIAHVLTSLQRLRPLDALIPQPIVDHVPTIYATQIWNNIP